MRLFHFSGQPSTIDHQHFTIKCFDGQSGEEEEKAIQMALLIAIKLLYFATNIKTKLMFL